MSAIKVTSIMPVYNGAAYLKDALDSFCEQTLEDTELLVIDDQSTDSSAEIIRDYQSRDPRIVYFKTEHRYGGPWGGRNLGIERARGEYLHFIDQDDRYASRFALSHAYATAKRFNATFVAGNCDYIFGSPQDRLVQCPSPARTPYLDTARHNWREYPNYPIIWQVMFKTVWLREHTGVRFGADSRCEDSLFMLRVIAASQDFVSLKHPLYAYRCNYRFVDISEQLLEEHLRTAQEYIELFYKSGLDAARPEILSRDRIPTSLGWNSPLGKIALEELTELYGLTETKALALLEQYNTLRDTLLAKYPDAGETQQRACAQESDTYTLGTRARLRFYASPNFDQRNAFRLKRFEKVRFLHLMCNTQDFTPLIDFFNAGHPEEHLFIFVRSNDVMPYMHFFLTPEGDNVLNFVNLKGLNNYFYPLFERCEKIFIHSLQPRPLFLFLKQHPELTAKCVLQLFGDTHVGIYAQDTTVTEVLRQIPEVYSLPSGINDLSELLTTKPSTLSLDAFKVMRPQKLTLSTDLPSTAVVSDAPTFVLDTLKTLKTEDYHGVCDCYFNGITPMILSGLRAQIAALPINFKVNCHYGTLTTEALQRQPYARLYVYQERLPSPVDLLLYALQAGLEVHVAPEDEPLLQERRDYVQKT